MKNRIILWCLILVIISQYSCKDFSQIVEIDIPEHEPKLATLLTATSLDSALNVLVSNSLGILESRDTQPIKDARVSLLRNGHPIAEGIYREGTYYYELFTNAPLGTAAATYRLEMSAPDFPPIYAEQKMPAAVPILSARIELDGTIDAEGRRADEVILEFQDPAGSTDYYAVAMQGLRRLSAEEDSLYTAGTVALHSNDPSYGFVRNFPYNLIFSDAAFDGQKVRISVYSYDHLGEFSGQLRLYHLSRDVYLYHRSLDLYEEAIDNPFAEPVNVHRNIENGYGLFGVSSVSEVVLEE
ncbi:DUF4249 domain-containing protein [Flavilitoribacter nigricans]|uniref:DUF4249 domain-containing protein n=1 Tax=Flavilitoribacter nigricans (strain ATCC 23147 / DSM 23189 / NBRC 102662 / NCIMB 1420 / SS-2) TaxID=1122177 RepID=A0A2D0MYF9_FLAN2|nr:DUF4249 domain-containing protein [Flavilitoribacter nigricans]PHN01285.1 hypothetical protein CRP01_38045 [Flavilitoribacter nigricans DSM 23189 = NBRC 102662]